MSGISQAAAKAAWLELRAEFLRRCAQIDRETPWSNTEPQWWLDMQRAEKAVRETQA